MARSPEGERLPKLIGEAIVVWSQIEATWAHIFFQLVYAGIGEPLGLDVDDGRPVVQEDPRWAEKRNRAAAVFFSVPSSKNQRRMVVELAKVALKEKPEVLNALKKLANRTDKMSEWRNKFAHAYYDRPLLRRGNAVFYGPIAVSELGKHQFTEAEISNQIVEFGTLRNLMNHAMLAVVDLDDPPVV